jgi:transmembrane sensor
MRIGRNLMRLFVDYLHRRQIARSAARWHSRMLEPASEREVAAFEQWLDAHPRHARAYADIDAIARAGERAPRRHLVTVPLAARFRPAFAVVTVSVLAVAAVLLLNIHANGPAYAAVVNPGAAVRTVMLEDGTRVTLDPGAELGVLIGNEERHIEVRAGRSRIEVRPDSRRPLLVSLPGGDISFAQGTLDVSIDGDNSEVSALTEALTLTSFARNGRSSAVRLAGGQTLFLNDARARPMPTQPAALRWPDARRQFDEAALVEVLRFANRDASVPIVVEDTNIGRLKVTGILDIRDTRALARKLAAALNLQIDERPDRIILIR